MSPGGRRRQGAGAVIAAALLAQVGLAGAAPTPGPTPPALALTDIRVEALFGLRYGYGRFDLSQQRQVAGLGGELQAQRTTTLSQDILMAGARGTLTAGRGPRTVLEVSLELLTSAADPAGSLEVEASVSSYPLSISQTVLHRRSAGDTARVLAGGASALLRVADMEDGPNDFLYLTLSYLHEWQHHEGSGAVGWSLGDRLERASLVLAPGVVTDSYEVQLMTPSLGVGLRLNMGPVTVDGQAAIGLVVAAEERQDRLLGHTWSGTTYGASIAVRLHPRLRLPLPLGGGTHHLSLGVDQQARVLTSFGALDLSRAAGSADPGEVSHETFFISAATLITAGVHF